MKTWTLILAGTVVVAHGLAHAETKVDFAKEIQPILQKSCVECHGAEKQRGKLRLDTKQETLKEGDPRTVVPGDAAASELYRRITLPAGHDDIMPNKGEPLTKAQTDLIRDWINQGADWPDSLVIASPGAEAEKDTKAAQFKPTAAEDQAIAELEKSGISARPIAMNVPWREVSFHLVGSSVTDETIAPIKNILSLVHVNLAGTKISDSGLATLSSLTNLSRLHLERTEITDAGLSHLKPLSNLTYLNLYGTQISDAGLDHLKGLTNLKRIYLWQTKVTDEGVAKLAQALPNLEISRGWELKLAANEPENEGEKKEDNKDGEKKEDAKKEGEKKDGEKKDPEKKEAGKEDEKK